MTLAFTAVPLAMSMIMCTSIINPSDGILNAIDDVVGVAVLSKIVRTMSIHGKRLSGILLMTQFLPLCIDGRGHIKDVFGLAPGDESGFDHRVRIPSISRGLLGIEIKCNNDPA